MQSEQCNAFLYGKHRFILSKDEKKNITASVLQRLKNYSEARKEDRGLTLTNYAIERLLYRLSISQYADQFILKGAQLFRLAERDKKSN